MGFHACILKDPLWATNWRNYHYHHQPTYRWKGLITTRPCTRNRISFDVLSFNVASEATLPIEFSVTKAASDRMVIHDMVLQAWPFDKFGVTIRKAAHVLRLVYARIPMLSASCPFIHIDDLLEWIVSWRRSLDPVGKLLSHPSNVQGKAFLPVCVHMWCLNWNFLVNASVHPSHVH